MADKSGKKSHKAVTLDTKIKIIKLSEDGVSNSDIGRRLDLARTTVDDSTTYEEYMHQ
jgi:DNA-binding NarL/FixJ family response regulator